MTLHSFWVVELNKWAGQDNIHNVLRKVYQVKTLYLTNDMSITKELHCKKAIFCIVLIYIDVKNSIKLAIDEYQTFLIP